MPFAGGSLKRVFSRSKNVVDIASNFFVKK